MDEPSITALKTSFIRTQVRHLEIPFEASNLAPAYSSTSPDNPQLSAKLQTDLIAKVNDKIRQHNRLIFSTQSQRHVAEQIESLHWNLVEAETHQAEIDTVGIRKDAELTDSQTIQGLPETLEELCLHPESDAHERELEKYSALRGELVELSEKRDALRRKLAQYQRLRTLTAPLEEPQKNIQPNLVTRDGELSQELDRMRVLLARVTGRVDERQTSDNSDEARQSNAGVAQTDQQKLARILKLG